jgi:hypothetical protein
LSRRSGCEAANLGDRRTHFPHEQLQVFSRWRSCGQRIQHAYRRKQAGGGCQGEEPSSEQFPKAFPTAWPTLAPTLAPSLWPANASDSDPSPAPAVPCGLLRTRPSFLISTSTRARCLSQRPTPLLLSSPPPPKYCAGLRAHIPPHVSTRYHS